MPSPLILTTQFLPLLFTLLFFLILPSVDGCGMTTHNVIANRALNHFFFLNPQLQPIVSTNYTELIFNNLGSVLGGAPFPDYLYTCGTNHSAGEVGHWSPFQAAVSLYIFENFLIKFIM